MKPKRSYSDATASSTLDERIHYPFSICGENSHLITRCHQFLKLSPNERYKSIKEKILCLNCLSNKHKINQCRSSNSCSVCKNRHYCLFHFNKEASKVAEPTGDSISESNVSHSGISLMVADSVNRHFITYS